ncbi:hypothetical protein GN956_G8378 [Arapaima gigas]
MIHSTPSPGSGGATVPRSGTSDEAARGCRYCPISQTVKERPLKAVKDSRSARRPNWTAAVSGVWFVSGGHAVW